MVRRKPDAQKRFIFRVLYWMWPWLSGSRLLQIIFRIFCWMVGISLMERRTLETDPSAYYGLDYEEISFWSRGCPKPVLLRGWYIPCKNSKACIIMVHGINANRAQLEVGLLEIAKALVEAGYNILMFDLRAHGESEGTNIGLGYFEGYDILGARDFLVNQKKIPADKIGIMGFSLGAFAAIVAVGKEKLEALVLDSCPGNTLKIAQRRMVKHHIPFWLFGPAKWLLKKVYKIDADGINTREIIEKTKTAIFFIHGKKDDLLYADVLESFRAKRKNAKNDLDRLWIVTGVPHVQCYRIFPKEYLRRIIEFFNAALKPASK